MCYLIIALLLCPTLVNANPDSYSNHSYSNHSFTPDLNSDTAPPSFESISSSLGCGYRIGEYAYWLESPDCWPGVIQRAANSIVETRFKHLAWWLTVAHGGVITDAFYIKRLYLLAGLMFLASDWRQEQNLLLQLQTTSITLGRRLLIHYYRSATPGWVLTRLSTAPITSRESESLTATELALLHLWQRMIGENIDRLYLVRTGNGEQLLIKEGDFPSHSLPLIDEENEPSPDLENWLWQCQWSASPPPQNTLMAPQWLYWLHDALDCMKGECQALKSDYTGQTYMSLAAPELHGSGREEATSAVIHLGESHLIMHRSLTGTTCLSSLWLSGSDNINEYSRADSGLSQWFISPVLIESLAPQALEWSLETGASILKSPLASSEHLMVPAPGGPTRTLFQSDLTIPFLKYSESGNIQAMAESIPGVINAAKRGKGQKGRKKASGTPKSKGLVSRKAGRKKKGFYHEPGQCDEDDSSDDEWSASKSKLRPGIQKKQKSRKRKPVTDLSPSPKRQAVSHPQTMTQPRTHEIISLLTDSEPASDDSLEYQFTEKALDSWATDEDYSDYPVLKALLKNRYVPVPVPADGHCYFSALAKGALIQEFIHDLPLRSMMTGPAVRRKIYELYITLTWLFEDDQQEKLLVSALAYAQSKQVPLSHILWPEESIWTRNIPVLAWGGDYLHSLAVSTLNLQLFTLQYRDKKVFLNPESPNGILSPHVLQQLPENQVHQLNDYLTDHRPAFQKPVRLLMQDDHYEPWITPEEHAKLKQCKERLSHNEQRIVDSLLDGIERARETAYKKLYDLEVKLKEKYPEADPENIQLVDSLQDASSQALSMERPRQIAESFQTAKQQVETEYEPISSSEITQPEAFLQNPFDLEQVTRAKKNLEQTVEAYQDFLTRLSEALNHMEEQFNARQSQQQALYQKLESYEARFHGQNALIHDLIEDREQIRKAAQDVIEFESLLLDGTAKLSSVEQSLEEVSRERHQLHEDCIHLQRQVSELRSKNDQLDSNHFVLNKTIASLRNKILFTVKEMAGKLGFIRNALDETPSAEQRVFHYLGHLQASLDHLELYADKVPSGSREISLEPGEHDAVEALMALSTDAHSEIKTSGEMFFTAKKSKASTFSDNAWMTQKIKRLERNQREREKEADADALSIEQLKDTRAKERMAFDQYLSTIQTSSAQLQEQSLRLVKAMEQNQEKWLEEKAQWAMEIALLQGQLSQYDIERESQHASFQQLKLQSLASEASSKLYESQLSTREEEIRGWQEKVASLKTEHDITVKNLRQERQKHEDQLTQKLAESKGEIETYKRLSQESERLSEQYQKENEQLLAELNKLKRHPRAENALIRKKERIITDKIRLLEKKEEEIEALQTSITSLQTELEASKSSLTAQMFSWEQNEKVWESNLKLEQEVQQLKEETVISAIYLMSLKGETKQLNDEINVRKEQQDALAKTADNFSSELQEALLTVEQQAHQLEEQTSRLTDNEQDVYSLEGELTELEKIIREKEQQLDTQAIRHRELLRKLQKNEKKQAQDQAEVEQLKAALEKTSILVLNLEERNQEISHSEDQKDEQLIETFQRMQTLTEENRRHIELFVLHEKEWLQSELDRLQHLFSELKLLEDRVQDGLPEVAPNVPAREPLASQVLQTVLSELKTEVKSIHYTGVCCQYFPEIRKLREKISTAHREFQEARQSLLTCADSTKGHLITTLSAEDSVLADSTSETLIPEVSGDGSTDLYPEISPMETDQRDDPDAVDHHESAVKSAQVLAMEQEILRLKKQLAELEEQPARTIPEIVEPVSEATAAVSSLRRETGINIISRNQHLSLKAITDMLIKKGSDVPDSEELRDGLAWNTALTSYVARFVVPISRQKFIHSPTSPYLALFKSQCDRYWQVLVRLLKKNSPFSRQSLASLLKHFRQDQVELPGFFQQTDADGGPSTWREGHVYFLKKYRLPSNSDITLSYPPGKATAAVAILQVLNPEAIETHPSVRKAFSSELTVLFRKKRDLTDTEMVKWLLEQGIPVPTKLISQKVAAQNWDAITVGDVRSALCIPYIQFTVEAEMPDDVDDIAPPPPALLNMLANRLATIEPAGEEFKSTIVQFLGSTPEVDAITIDRILTLFEEKGVLLPWYLARDFGQNWDEQRLFYFAVRANLPPWQAYYRKSHQHGFLGQLNPSSTEFEKELELVFKDTAQASDQTVTQILKPFVPVPTTVKGQPFHFTEWTHEAVKESRHRHDITAPEISEVTLGSLANKGIHSPEFSSGFQAFWGKTSLHIRPKTLVTSKPEKALHSKLARVVILIRNHNRKFPGNALNVMPVRSATSIQTIWTQVDVILLMIHTGTLSEAQAIPLFTYDNLISALSEETEYTDRYWYLFRQLAELALRKEGNESKAQRKIATLLRDREGRDAPIPILPDTLPSARWGTDSVTEVFRILNTLSPSPSLNWIETSANR